MRIRLSILGLVAATVLAGAIPASAAQVTDPDDTAGPLDLHAVRVTRGSGGALHVQISTFGPWKKTLLFEQPHRLFVLFDTATEGGAEYIGRINCSEKNDLFLSIKGKDGSQYEPLPVKKPSGTTVRFTVPGGAPMDPKGVGIAVRSRYVDTDNTYKDRAPDSEFVSET